MLLQMETRLSIGSDGENSCSLCTWNNHRVPPTAGEVVENGETSDVVDETVVKSQLSTPQPCSELPGTSSIVHLRSDVP